MQDLIVTLVQADLEWKDPAANLNKFTSILDELTEPIDLIVLPEMFTTGFVVEPELFAETMDGRTIEWLREQSRSHLCVITGSLLIREGQHFLNRLIWMQPDGTFSFYDKRHLFTYGKEHIHFHRGSGRIITEIKGWHFLPLICYDLRFPVWSRNIFSEGNYQYDCLIYMANWPYPRNHAWKNLLIGRALENLSYVIGVNRVGKDGHGLLHTGDSAVIDPMGMAVTTISPEEEVTATVRLSAGLLQETRNKLAFGQDWDGFELTDI
jgi:predicted amidohydrolase